jgi:metal transporter CNNM
VADDLPLYDILNEFQKGHSHMAVVVKRTKEAGASAEKNNGVPSDYKINHVHADGTCFIHPFLHMLHYLISLADYLFFK